MKSKKVKEIKKEKIEDVVNEEKQTTIEKEKFPMIKHFFKLLFLFFLLYLLIGSLLSESIFENIEQSKYGMDFISEMVSAGIVLIILLCFGNSYIFKEKRMDFKTSLKLVWPFLLFSVLLLLNSIISLTVSGFDFSRFVNLVLFCFSIGVTEEFMCRGWLQNEFIERFAKDKKQVIFSIILSSLIFGGMHIFNVIMPSQNLFETIMQVIQATAAGFLLGSIYYKTKNIWLVVALHAFYDFSIMLGELMYLRDCTTGTYTSVTTGLEILDSIVIVSILILTAILVLRSHEGPAVLKENKSSSFNNRSLTISIIALIVITNYVIALMPGMDKVTYCYEYQTKEVEDNFEVSFRNAKDYNYVLYNQSGDKKLTIRYDDVVSSTVIISGKENFILNKINENEYFSDIYVYETDKYYNIIAQDESDAGRILYTQIDKDTIVEDDVEYLRSIKSSFKEFILPNVKKMGYMIEKGGVSKKPYFETELGDEFIIDKNQLYQLKVKE